MPSSYQLGTSAHTYIKGVIGLCIPLYPTGISPASGAKHHPECPNAEDWSEGYVAEWRCSPEVGRGAPGTGEGYEQTRNKTDSTQSQKVACCLFLDIFSSGLSLLSGRGLRLSPLFCRPAECFRTFFVRLFLLRRSSL